MVSLSSYRNRVVAMAVMASCTSAPEGQSPTNTSDSRSTGNNSGNGASAKTTGDEDIELTTVFDDGASVASHGDDHSSDTELDTGATHRFDLGPVPDTPSMQCVTCSTDFTSIFDCEGNLLEVCEDGLACDETAAACTDPCDAARRNRRSVGCEYAPTVLPIVEDYPLPGAESNFSGCFAVFISNTWSTPASLNLRYGDRELSVEAFARVPVGHGPQLKYEPFDAAAGLPPGGVAIVFLAHATGDFGPLCPIEPALVDEGFSNETGIVETFWLESDVPVVVNQILPYGGGSAAKTGASLLIPTSAWGRDYVVVQAGPEVAGWGLPFTGVIAHRPDTKVTIEPWVTLEGGGAIPGGPAGSSVEFAMEAGQFARIVQSEELTGSIVRADKPIGLFGGHTALQVPLGTNFADHAEQMIPRVHALGTRYVGVMHPPRAQEPAIWRVVAAADDTKLRWSEDVGGPAQISRGDAIDFVTERPFVVESQGPSHPFLLVQYMSGSTWAEGGAALGGQGDADFVISIPPEQYLQKYVFFADPTYPSTALVVIREAEDGQFYDVSLDCAGVLGGWQPVGEGFEWTRVQLSRGNFEPVGGCSTGRHQIESAGGRFGLWVWGWGTPGTMPLTEHVSYGYPGGMNLSTINEIDLDPEGRL